MKVAVIFGGMSTEHDVSIASGTSVIRNLDKEKYDIYPIYIDKNGDWYKYTKKAEELEPLKVGEKLKHVEKIENIINYLKQVDVIFPVLHGLYGEDGTIQGLFELIKKPYVGCKTLSSSLAMDKAYAKMIFEKAKIKQTKHIFIKKIKNNYILIKKDLTEKMMDIDKIGLYIAQKINFPMFIKPSNSGSSVGIKKAKTLKELKDAIINAEKYDRKIIIEEGISGREIECAVLGNEDVLATCVGEILPSDEFYSYEAKYENKKSKTIIPANMDKSLQDKIKKIAVKAFKAIDGRGLSRVDFFLKENGEILLNEINTMPGFTEISMYSKLWNEEGLSYSVLLDKLINLAIEK